MAVAPSSRSLYSVSLDGTSNDGIDCGTGSSLQNLSQSAMTVACWVKINHNSSFGQLVGRSDGNSVNAGWTLRVNAGANRFDFVKERGSVNLTASADFPGGNAFYDVWHHVLVTFDGGTTAANATIYIDGVAQTLSVSTDGSGANGSDAAQSFKIGYRSGWGAPITLIDEVAVWTSQLSATDASNIANGLTNVGDYSPAGYWKLEEGTSTTANDSSGNANTGTLGSGASWSSDVTAYLQDYATSGYQTGSTYNFKYRNGAVGGDKSYMSIGVSMLSVAGSSVSSITVDGVSASFQLAKASVSGAVRVEYWDILLPDRPTTTALAVAVTLSAALDSVTSCQVFKGVDSAPIDKTASASATNVGAADATVSVTTAVDADYLFAVVASDDTTITVGTGQTETENVSGTLGSGAISYKGPISPAGSATMYWTGVGALATWSIIVVAFQPLQSAVDGAAWQAMFPEAMPVRYKIVAY